MTFLQKSQPARGHGLFVRLALCGLLFITGCAKGQIKLTDTEHQIHKIEAFLLSLQDVYSKKDSAALRPLFSPHFLDQHPGLFESLQKGLDGEVPPRLNLVVDLIQIDGQQVLVMLHWDVNTPPSQGSLQHRGNTTLQLLEQETLQITALEGDNPFTWPTTHAD